MKKYLFGAILFATSAAALGEKQCETNFKKEGGFFKGTTFKTSASLEGTETDNAFKKIYQHIAKDGWKIVSSDKDLGIISASQEVSYGDGKTAPLNIVIEEATPGTKISISYSLSGGVSSPKKAVMESFCGTISSAQ